MNRPRHQSLSSGVWVGQHATHGNGTIPYMEAPTLYTAELPCLRHAEGVQAQAGAPAEKR